jgi:hypothetical protein
VLRAQQQQLQQTHPQQQVLFAGARAPRVSVKAV